MYFIKFILKDELNEFFSKINRVKPEASRSDSSEIYLLCTGFLMNEKNESLNQKLDNLIYKNSENDGNNGSINENLKKDYKEEYDEILDFLKYIKSKGASNEGKYKR